MELRTAKGFERLSMDIGEHVRFYTPKSWIEPIGSVDHTPFFSANEAKVFMSAHKEGSLNKKLEELSKTPNFSYIPLQSWYVREAIEDFFNKSLYSEYEKEL